MRLELGPCRVVHSLVIKDQNGLAVALLTQDEMRPNTSFGRSPSPRRSKASKQTSWSRTSMTDSASSPRPPINFETMEPDVAGFRSFFPYSSRVSRLGDADGVVHVMAVLEDGELECVNGVEAGAERRSSILTGRGACPLGRLESRRRFLRQGAKVGPLTRRTIAHEDAGGVLRPSSRPRSRLKPYRAIERWRNWGSDMSCIPI